MYESSNKFGVKNNLIEIPSDYIDELLLPSSMTARISSNLDLMKLSNCWRQFSRTSDIQS
jgi:hypothetical protein